MLYDHLRAVGELSRDIVYTKKIESRDLIAQVAYLIGVTHDFGKATTYFQELINKDERSRKARHGLLSSLFTYQVVKNHLSSIGRLHEFQHLPVLSWLVVKRHHGNMRNLWGEPSAEISALNKLSEKSLIEEQISNIIENNRDELSHVYADTLRNEDLTDFLYEIRSWTRLATQIASDARQLRREEKVENYLSMLFLYSVLLDSDKMDASGTSSPVRIVKVNEDLVDDYRTATFKEPLNAINKCRDHAYRDVMSSLSMIDIKQDRLLSLNLPTGIGKTLAGFSFCLKLRNKIETEAGFLPRIIYCLPFLSIVDQTSDILERVLGRQFHKIPSNALLKHHHLADIYYIEQKEEELYSIYGQEKALLLMEAWDSEIVITTFVQFFHSLITNRNRSARKFHNIANSIVILDEVQAIPSKYWPLINQMLNLLVTKFDCRVVLMTATQPLVFSKDNMTELVHDKTEFLRAFDRVEYHVNLRTGKLVPEPFEEFQNTILKEITQRNDKNIMIIMNTIRSCQKLFDFVKNHLVKTQQTEEEPIDEDGICCFKNLELINLSTYVLPATRLRRIRRIKNDACRKIIVTTQLVEAGVDISADIVYRDLAPLDCIIQSAGRCNRNNKPEKGLFKIVLVTDEHNRPFHSIYDRTLVNATEEVLQALGPKFSEWDMTTVIEKYFEKVKRRISAQGSRIIIESMKKLDLSEVGKFELIEDTAKSMSIFVESDDHAVQVRKKVMEILENSTKFAKRTELDAIRKDVSENTINVRYTSKMKNLNHLPTLFDEDFRYIPKEHLDTWYRQDIGLTIPSDN